MIEVKEAGKMYGDVKAVEDVDWTVSEGEWWGIIGPNGSGKTTLLQLLSGVEQATSGTISIQGKNVREYPRKQLSRMMAVLQQDGLPPIHYPVREVLEMGRYPYQNWMGRDEDDNADQLIDNIIEQLELTELAERPLDELSGGQRQRVAFGKIMAQEPQILLLDEPTTYLDIRHQVQFMELVAQWRSQIGMTVIAVLHDLNLAAQFCDKLLVMQDGSVIGSGTPEEILTYPNLRQVYDVEPVIIPHPASGVPQVLLSRSHQR